MIEEDTIVELERLPAEELSRLVAQQNAARLTALQAQLEEAKFSNLVLSMRLKHNLSETDSVDTNTGIISRAEASRA